MNKVIISITAATLICSAATAQDYNRHELSIGIDGGISGFQTRPVIGKKVQNWAGAIGGGYHYFFHPQWGVGTGVKFAIYNGGIAINNYSATQSSIITATGERFDFLVTSTDYKEPQQAMMFTIPLMLQYQGLGEKAFYAAAGVKAGFPVSAKSKTKGTFTSQGYFPDVNITCEDLPDYGFVNDHAFPKDKTDLGLKTSLMASAEAGIKWRLSETRSLYTGIYVDYGLNDLLDKNSNTAANTNLVVYQTNNPSQFAYNTAVSSYAKKVAPFSAGITVRLAFGISCKRKAEATSETVPSEADNLMVEEQKPDDAALEAQRLADEEAARQRAAEEAAAEKARQEEVAAAEKARQEEEAARQQAEAKKQTISKIQLPIDYYPVGVVVLSDIQKQELDRRIAILKENPDFDVFVYGHTCDIGTGEANERVGLGRAQKAKEYMISQGIAENRIVGIATKRDTEPIAPNTDEENRKLNRRVELVIVE